MHVRVHELEIRGLLKCQSLSFYSLKVAHSIQSSSRRLAGPWASGSLRSPLPISGGLVTFDTCNHAWLFDMSSRGQNQLSDLSIKDFPDTGSHPRPIVTFILNMASSTVGDPTVLPHFLARKEQVMAVPETWIPNISHRFLYFTPESSYKPPFSRRQRHLTPTTP